MDMENDVETEMGTETETGAGMGGRSITIFGVILMHWEREL